MAMSFFNIYVIYTISMNNTNRIVQIGSTIYLKKLKRVVVITLLKDNPDPLSGKITIESPLGELLLGKKEKDKIRYNNIEYKIEKIR